MLGGIVAHPVTGPPKAFPPGVTQKATKHRLDGRVKPLRLPGGAWVVRRRDPQLHFGSLEDPCPKFGGKFCIPVGNKDLWKPPLFYCIREKQFGPVDGCVCGFTGGYSNSLRKLVHYNHHGIVSVF